MSDHEQAQDQATAAKAMTQLVTEMARALVDAPGQVLVRHTIIDNIVCLELRVANDDLGKVIGKQGRTARSMRVILNALSMRSRQRFSLEILPLSDPVPTHTTTESTT